MRSYAYDVAVIGGGPAGLAAAISAKRAGAKAVLVERSAFFGGNATQASVAAFCGFYTRGENPDEAVAGVGGELLQRMKAAGYYVEVCRSAASGNTTVKFNPEELKVALDDFLVDEGVECLLHATLVSCEEREGRIVSALCCDDEGPFTLEASQFVDATGNASLAHLACARCEWGESEGQVQQASLVFRLEGLPAREIAPSELKAAIIAGKQSGMAHLHKEGGVIIKSGISTYGYCTIPSVSVSSLEASDLTRNEMELRRQARAYAEAFARFIPDCGSCHIASSGPVMGLRESRRIVGLSQIEGEAILAGEKREDSVARAAWSPEIHRSGSDPRYEHIPDNDYASIPFGTLKSADVSNLWVAGRAISCDALALASIRVMGTAMATGQAAGIAAAFGCSGNEIDIEELRKALLDQGALI